MLGEEKGKVEGGCKGILMTEDERRLHEFEISSSVDLPQLNEKIFRLTTQSGKIATGR